MLDRWPASGGRARIRRGPRRPAGGRSPRRTRRAGEPTTKRRRPGVTGRCGLRECWCASQGTEGRGAPRARAGPEGEAILELVPWGRFADTAPAEAWATLLDEGTYLGSVSTYFRVLREAGESRERRAQAAHPAAVKPELAATGPNQVYSWDITKLHGPAKWAYYHLYVILHIFSRYEVASMVATRE